MTDRPSDTPDANVDRMRFVSVVWRLTGVNSLWPVLALVTSPILAHGLGPDGRGELAAIATAITLAPWISDLGLTAYLTRERARGTSIGLLLGSVVPIAIASSLVGVATAVPLAHLLGQGRETVILFVEIGLFILPLTVFLHTLYGIVLGEERWRTVMATIALASTIPAVAIVLLSVTNFLTVETVSIAYLVASVVANVPLLVSLRGSRPWRFRGPVSRSAISFGLKSWLATLTNKANERVDLLFMAALVSSRQLGLYALAVTLSTASGSLIGAVSHALFPRIAGGDVLIAARACRVTTLLVGAVNVVIAALSPVLVPIVFGEAFAETVPMLLILLVASVFLVAGQVLTVSVTAAGDPASGARAQTLGLVVAIPLLLVLLPSLGGIGAAWISLASYAISLAVVLRAATRVFDLPATHFLVPRVSDIKWLRGRLLQWA